MSRANTIRRNPAIDFLKCVCAFMVICIHMQYKGKDALELMTRVAVPLFFLITGYFYANVKERNGQWRQIKKVLVLVTGANLLYLLWQLVYAWVKSESVAAVIRSWGDIQVWIRCAVWNVSPFGTHLWYLNALLYVLLIVAVWEKFLDRKKLYCLIPVLLVGNLLLGNYAKLLLQQKFPLEVSRNYLFLGLPWFLSGDLLHTYRDKAKIRSRVLLPVLAGSVILMYWERSFLQRMNAYVLGELFFGTIFSVTAVFLLVLNNEAWFCRGIPGKAACVGRKLSLGIYILHPIVIGAVNTAAEILGKYIPAVTVIYPYISPILVMGATAAVVALSLSAKDFLTARVQRIRA